jgi:phage shock protein E
MVIIDVRSADEYNASHIAGAINIDVVDIQSGTLPSCSPDTQILLYCRSGGRAGIAIEILRDAGFTNVTNRGGLMDMVAAGFGIDN